MRVPLRKFERMLRDTSISRREMLAALGAAGLGLRINPSSFRTHAMVAPSQYGVQLYTVRSLFSSDPAGTLKALAAIGYREVETAGYANLTPAQMRKALDDAGLSSPAAHVSYEQVTGNLMWHLDACHTVGHKWLVVPSLPGSVRNPDGYKAVAQALGQAAEIAKKSEIRIAYHNHDIDFAPVGETTGMSMLLDLAPPNTLFAELDVYWIVRAGHDPFAFLDRYKGRVKMLHLKDSAGAAGTPAHEMREVGKGVIEWPRLIARASDAGVEHLFVEHDRPGDAMASVKGSYEYLVRSVPLGRGAGR